MAAASASPCISPTPPSLSGWDEVNWSNRDATARQINATYDELIRMTNMIREIKKMPLDSSRIMTHLIDMTTRVVECRQLTSYLFKKTLQFADYTWGKIEESRQLLLEQSCNRIKRFIDSEISIVYSTILEALKLPEESMLATGSTPDPLPLPLEEKQKLLEQVQKNQQAIKLQWKTWKDERSRMSAKEQNKGDLSKLIEFLDMETGDMLAILEALSKEEEAFELKFSDTRPLRLKDLLKRRALASFLKNAQRRLSEDAHVLTTLTEDILSHVIGAFRFLPAPDTATSST